MTATPTRDNATTNARKDHRGGFALGYGAADNPRSRLGWLLCARGRAGGFRLDFLALTTAPDLFRDPEWIKAIESRCGTSPAKWQDEEYGQVWSRRIWLKADRHELD
jgi:hypothetical protein